MQARPYPCDANHNITNGDDGDNLEPRVVLAALVLQRESRDYLSQLVSAILHSPAPLTQSTMYTLFVDY